DRLLVEGRDPERGPVGALGDAGGPGEDLDLAGGRQGAVAGDVVDVEPARLAARGEDAGAVGADDEAAEGPRAVDLLDELVGAAIEDLQRPHRAAGRGRVDDVERRVEGDVDREAVDEGRGPGRGGDA